MSQPRPPSLPAAEIHVVRAKKSSPSTVRSFAKSATGTALRLTSKSDAQSFGEMEAHKAKAFAPKPDMQTSSTTNDVTGTAEEKATSDHSTTRRATFLGTPRSNPTPNALLNRRDTMKTVMPMTMRLNREKSFLTEGISRRRISKELTAAGQIHLSKRSVVKSTLNELRNLKNSLKTDLSRSYDIEHQIRTRREELACKYNMTGGRML